MWDTKSPDVRALEAEAYDQHGYFTTPQARRHGITNQLLNHHLKTGRFVRVRRGLYRIQGFPRSEHDDIREKWMAVGMDKAIVSHESALALFDLSDTIPSKVHLLVSRSHKSLRPPAGVIIHSHVESEPVSKVTRDGIVVTAPARTLVDSADTLQPEQLELAVRQGVQRGLLTRSQLLTEAAHRRKEATIKRVLGRINA